MHCGIHAVNNLVQFSCHSSATFEEIIQSLPVLDSSWFSPYRSSIPKLGNYDASVVITAIHQVV